MHRNLSEFQEMLFFSYLIYVQKIKKSVEMIKSQPEMVTLFAAFKPL